MFELIRHRNLFLGLSGVLVLASIVALIVFGLTPGTDLAGGTRWQVIFPEGAVDVSMITSALHGIGVEAIVTEGDENIFTIRLGAIDEATHAVYRAALEKLGSVEEQNFSSIGPTVGAELERKAMNAIVFVLLGISLYIAWAFRKVSAPVKSWKYGVVTLVTLFHDVVVPAGLLAVLGAWKGIEIDTNFIVALLFVMGFSVHDTIVVFDRIRENLLRAAGREEFSEVVNRSVRETFARSLNTSVTLILVLAAMMALGPASLFYFILTILVGTVVGTYSSIFVASPLLYLLGRGKK
ncbi:MAG: protein translocase subunit SecF [Candidatus Jorgensenbacteria bacterium]|nr:protein translocase subunit SecF [Candidatus Jorgensenbacteria bacterium]